MNSLEQPSCISQSAGNLVSHRNAVDRIVWSDEAARLLLRRMFDAAVHAANPLYVLAKHLPEPPAGRCIVVGAGKAAASMAVAVDAAWPSVNLSGAVVVPYGYTCGHTSDRIQILEASHPLPDDSSQRAAREMLRLVSGLSSQDLVLALISGGGSSVLALPVDGITLADKQAVNQALLTSGLDIRSMNAIRRRLSAIKGGKLAVAASPARVVTLALSDIPGDDIASIASGPTLPDPLAGQDLSSLAAPLLGRIDPAVFNRIVTPPNPSAAPTAGEARLIATPGKSLKAAAEIARRAGFEAIIVGDDLEGESCELARAQCQHALALRGNVVLLSGGETTVELIGNTNGRGGRNTEFALALALLLEGAPGIWALAADTDGEDGTCGGGAGAVITPTTIARGRAADLNLSDYLDRHDSGSLFAELGDLLITGPTCTNVNDFRAILVSRP
jgi:glycerate 2-kinase